MKILLVEDDEFIAQSLEDILRDRYYIVDRAAEGQLGWEFVETYDYDLILLDIVLPKLNGIEFCQKLRSVGNQTPVLLLTAQDSKDNKVIGLDAGADDYVVKPFEVSELLARIRVLLRRRNSLTSQILQWEKLSLDSNTHEVTYQEKLIILTPKEYRLLELFLRSGDRVLTREIIFDRLWDVEEAPSVNTISAHIKELRRKLKQAGANSNLIETVYGIGYRLQPLTNTTKSLSHDAEMTEVDGENLSSKQKFIPSNDAGESEKTLRQKTKQALAGVWQKFEGAHRDRLEILEQANRAWHNDTIDDELLQQARYTAHKLAGGLGVFGFAEGSRLALAMEQLLNIELNCDDTHLNANPRDRAKKFSELLTALKNSLNPDFELQSKIVTQNRPVILAVDDRPELVERLTAEMIAMGMKYQLVSEPRSWEKALNQNNLDTIIWKFSLAECSVKTFNDLAQTLKQRLPLPVVVFTDNHDRGEQLKFFRVFKQILLQPATINNKDIKAIALALQQARKQTAKVLIVDDDPQLLEAIKSLLHPLNIKLITLNNPLKFWQAIAEFEPNLLILDVAMPHVTGIELCQLVRSDSRWRELPILFFTVHHDLGTIHKILSAGGNDWIGKAQSLELVPKIFTQIDRTQLYGRFANRPYRQLTTADK